MSGAHTTAERPATGGRRRPRLRRALLACAVGAAALAPVGVHAAAAAPALVIRHVEPHTVTTPAAIRPHGAADQPGCSATGVGSPTASTGYWLAGADGSVYSCGDAPWYGSLTSQHVRPDGPVVGITSFGSGYWLVTSRGAVYTFGQVQYEGRADPAQLQSPVVGMGTPLCQGWCGYWLVTQDGAVLDFGSPASALGSPGNIHLNSALVGMAVTPEPLFHCYATRLFCDQGYWLAAADGGVFAYGADGGDGWNGTGAHFLGSTGCMRLNQPIVGIAPSADTTDVGTNTACHVGPLQSGGYWMVARDGGIFAFGTAPFLGSTGCLVLNRPVVGMAASQDSTTAGSNTACLPAGGSAPLPPGGYLMFASDGGVFTFGNAGFVGSLPGSGIAVDDVVGGAVYAPL